MLCSDDETASDIYRRLDEVVVASVLEQLESMNEENEERRK